MSDDAVIEKGAEDIIQSVTDKVSAQVEAAIAEAKAMVSTEEVRPEREWNCYAYGPINLDNIGGDSQRVFYAGDDMIVITVAVFNDAGSPSTCDLIQAFKPHFTVKYLTGDLATWTPAPAYNRVVVSNVNPSVCYAINVLHIPNVPAPTDPNGDCFQMNICCSLTSCCDPDSPTGFAGFPSAVRNLSSDIFAPLFGGPGMPPSIGPHWEWNMPIKFMVANKGPL